MQGNRWRPTTRPTFIGIPKNVNYGKVLNFPIPVQQFLYLWDIFDTFTIKCRPSFPSAAYCCTVLRLILCLFSSIKKRDRWDKKNQIYQNLKSYTYYKMTDMCALQFTHLLTVFFSLHWLLHLYTDSHY